MARKSNFISIVQFDARSINHLRVHRSVKGLEIAAFHRISGTWSVEDGSLAAALRDFSAAHGLGDDFLCTVLPRHDVTTRILVLPTHDPKEAASMVRLSAEEYVPYPVDELIIDQCFLESLPNGEARVLAALAHQDVVNAHVDLLHQAGLEPDRIYLSSACLATAAAAAPPPSPPGEEINRYALVNLGSGGLEVLIMDRAKLQYGRGIASAQFWNRGEEESAAALEELAIEVRGSLAAYRRETEDGIGAGAVYLCSEGVDTAPIAQALAPELSVPCEPAAFANALVSKGLDHLDVLPLVSLGAAIAAQDRAPLVINLLPASLAEQRKLSGVRDMLIRAAALVVAVTLACAGLYYQAVQQRQAMIEELQRQADAIGPNARDVAAKQEQLQILRRQVSRSGSVMELLAGICDAAPESRVNITRFTFDRKEGINIWGRARTLDDVHAFTQSLRDLASGNLAAFAATHSLYEQETVERDETVYMYQLAIPFPEDKNAE